MKLLDAVALAKLENLELRARTVVEGALAGRHRSPHHGSSVEFAEHKEYAPGDEIKHLDWKAYAKFDRYYVKRYEEEAELRTYVVIDTSASMGYASHSTSKLDYARILAAALAYLLLKQQDHVGVMAFADRVVGYVPPRGRGSHLLDLLTSLETLTASGKTEIDRALTYVSEVARRRSLVVVLSDLLDASPRTRSLIRGLRARRHDVVVFHVLDSDELNFPFEEPTWLESPESGERLLVEPAQARRPYLAELERFIGDWRRSLREGDVEYHLVSTMTPPSEVLLTFLNDQLRAQGGGR
jgi:uncharacterized protein (DUF58 family)